MQLVTFSSFYLSFAFAVFRLIFVTFILYPISANDFTHLKPAWRCLCVLRSSYILMSSYFHIFLLQVLMRFYACHHFCLLCSLLPSFKFGVVRTLYAASLFFYTKKLNIIQKILHSFSWMIFFTNQTIGNCY